jgi:hypothetical protein
MRRLHAGVWTVLLSVFALQATVGAESPVSLDSLELRVPQAPGLQASSASIEAAIQDIRVQHDRSGLGYLFSASLGPAAIIVPRSFDDHVLRFQQQTGLSLPLLGARVAQQIAISSAQEREQLARITFEEARRERIASLRDAYTQYWQYDDEIKAARAYLANGQTALHQANVLLQTGFWTQSKLLDLLNSFQTVRSDAENYQRARLAQLANIDAALGTEINRFEPVAPDFFNACTPERAVAVESAIRSDATLANLEAQVAQVRTQYALVHGSSIDASASLQAGNTTDINHSVSGYDLQASINASLPMHARDEERGLRAEYAAQLESLQLQETQRNVELAAAVDALLEAVANAQTTLRQSINDVSARTGDLHKAIVRYNTIGESNGTGFDDVLAKQEELYTAQQAVAAARAAVLIQANDLLMLAPGACGGAYEAMPTPTPVPSPRRKRNG